MKKIVLPVLLSLALLGVGWFTLAQSWPATDPVAQEDASASDETPAESTGASQSQQTTASQVTTPGQTGVFVANDQLSKGPLVLVTDQQVMVTQSAGELVNVLFSSASAHYKFSHSGLQLAKEAAVAWNDMTDAFYAQTKNNSVTLVNCWMEKPTGFRAENRTGYGVDLQVVTDQNEYLAFGNHGDFQWIYKNAADYGFVQRFPADKEKATGFDEVAAHFRFVGVPHAQLMQQKNLVLEEYLELVRKHSLSAPLKHTSGGQTWQIYYVQLDKDADKTFLPLPGKDAKYEVSGDHTGGFIVTVQQSAVQPA